MHTNQQSRVCNTFRAGRFDSQQILHSSYTLETISEYADSYASAISMERHLSPHSHALIVPLAHSYNVTSVCDHINHFRKFTSHTHTHTRRHSNYLSRTVTPERQRQNERLVVPKTCAIAEVGTGDAMPTKFTDFGPPYERTNERVEIILTHKYTLTHFKPFSKLLNARVLC